MHNTLHKTSVTSVIGRNALQLQTNTTLTTQAGTAIITIGAIYASTSDYAFYGTGCSLILRSNMVTVFFFILVHPARDKLSITNIQLVHLNAVANIPTLFIILFISRPSDRQLPQ